MYHPLKLVIKRTKCSKDGNHTIFLQYCYTTTKRVILSTGISIPAMHWDKNSSCIIPSLPAAYGSATILQDSLDKQLTKAQRIVSYAIKKNHACPMFFLKRNFRLPDCWDFDQLEEDDNSISVFNQIDRYIEDKKIMVQPATITIIKDEKTLSFISKLYWLPASLRIFQRRFL